MIKLFQSIDKLYSSNGDKIILPLKAKVHKEDNGTFYLDLETDLSYVDDLTERAIIVAPTPQGDQAFRVTNPQKTRSKITAKCYHVFYDSENYLIEDSYVVEKNCNDALDHLNSATSDISPFTVSSNVRTITSYRCVRNSLYEAINTVLDRWGGHLVRDNFSIQIKNAIGQDNGVTVRYKKNLREISCEENWDNVVTKLLPVGKDGILLNELDDTADLYVYSSTQYELPYTKTVSFTQDGVLEEDYPDETAYKRALVDDLKEQAQIYINENCVPQINYTLKANLEKITDIGDTVEVIDERLGINIFTHVIAYDYDCILEKYTEIEFGNFKNKLSDLVGNITTSTTEKMAQSARTLESALEEELWVAVSEIWDFLGNGYVIFERDKILVVDRIPKESAANVIKIDQNGVNLSTTGVDGNFSEILSIDGTLDLSAAKSIILPDELKKSAMTRSLGAEITNLEINEDTIIPLDVSVSAGSRLTATSDGGIKVGAGVARILVSGRMSVNAGEPAGERHLRVTKNSSEIIAASSTTLAANDSYNLIVPPVLAEVQGGDVIYLSYNAPSGDDTILSESTALTVEIVG